MKYEGAFHGADVPFVFGDDFELSNDGERQLSRAMGCYWTNFATTGNPNTGPSACAVNMGLPEWPQFGSGDALELNVWKIQKRTGLKSAACNLFAGSHLQGSAVSQLSIIV